MSIGTKIYELRTAMNLSQGNLADMLDVSRQSVSKWETDAAVPDLDKLMRLCDAFSVTLDEITGRAVKEESKTPSIVTVVEKKQPMKHQKIIGYILLAVSLLAGIIIWLFIEREADLYIPLPTIVSALTCSLICLFVKRNAGYWCAWVIAAPIILLSSHSVGFFIPIPIVTNLLLVIFAVIMTLVARKLFVEVTIMPNRKKSIYVFLGWVALVSLRILNYVLVMRATIGSASAWLPYISLDAFSYIGASLLLTYTVCYLRSVTQNKKQ